MNKTVATVVVLMVIGLTLGCGSKTIEEQPKAEPPASVEKAPAAEDSKRGESLSVEKLAPRTKDKTASDNGGYQKLDPAELYIGFEAALTRLSVDSDGNVRAVDGIVKSMSVGATRIELASDKIAMEGSDAFVTTKDYGKIKVTFNSNAQGTFWVTPSQKKALLRLK